MIVLAVVALVLALAAVLAKDWLFARERERWTEERRELLLRIQAPRVAVARQEVEGLVPVPAVEPEDDGGYWDARKIRGAVAPQLDQLAQLSKEELADLAFQQETR